MMWANPSGTGSVGEGVSNRIYAEQGATGDCPLCGCPVQPMFFNNIWQWYHKPCKGHFCNGKRYRPTRKRCDGKPPKAEVVAVAKVESRPNVMGN